MCLWAILLGLLVGAGREDTAKPGRAGCAGRTRRAPTEPRLAVQAGEAVPTVLKSKRPTTAPAAKSALCPPDRCVMHSQTVQIIARLPDWQDQPAVTVDGKPLQTRRMWIKKHGHPASHPAGEPAERRQSVLVGTTSLAPGRHVIAAGSHKSRVWINPSKDRSKAPADWPVFRPHPGPVADCASCHKVNESAGRPLLGPANEPEPCLVCHDLDEFKLIHSHRLESLAACRMCHAPHGATTKAMLIDNPKALCAKCHD